MDIQENNITMLYSAGEREYQNRADLVNVAIADGVSEIGSFAFGRCEKLESVTVPSGLTGIGYCAFWACFSLASINIPDSVTLIDNFAFQECKSLTSVTIPDSVTEFGDDAFSGCKSLENITYKGNTYSRRSAEELYDVLPCFKGNITFDEFKRRIFPGRLISY